MTASGYSAVRWSAASRYAAQGTQFAISLVMARLLAPELFGLLGMATVFTGFAKVLNNLGFGAAIIQRKDVDQALLSSIFWVNLCLCSVLTLGAIAASPLVGWLYDDERVPPILIALSANLFIAGFVTVPAAMLQKQLDFKSLAVREIGSVVVMGLTGITLAWLNFGVWALVIASIAQQLSAALLLNAVSTFRPTRQLDRHRLRECVRFGIGITGTNIFNYFSRNADNVIIGVALGPLALGYYGFAYKLMLFPRNALTQVVNRVLFPKLSSIQDNDSEITEIVRKAAITIAAISFPLAACVMLFADPVIPQVLGEKWKPAIPLVIILAPVGAMQSLWSIATQIMLAKGRSDLFFRWGITNGFLMISSFLIGILFGVQGVATSYAIACFFWIPITFYMSFQLVEGLTARMLAKALMPYLLLTLSASLFGWITFIAAYQVMPDLVAVATAFLVGLASYIAGLHTMQLEVIEIATRLLPNSTTRILKRATTR